MKKLRNGLGSLLNKIFSKPIEVGNPSNFVVASVWFLRNSTFIFGLYQIIWGDLVVGLAIVLCAVFLIVPAIFTKNRITNIPLEIEFFLFLMVVVQFVLGEAHDFYLNIPYYDKFVHFFLPFLLGVIGFIVAYTLYFSGKLKVSIGAMIFFVIAITLGVGAFWEIIEYTNDNFILKVFPHWHKFQNSEIDTMSDLIADLIGGVIGALVALQYIVRSKYNKRIKELFLEIKKQLYVKNSSKKR